MAVQLWSVSLNTWLPSQNTRGYRPGGINEPVVWEAPCRIQFRHVRTEHALLVMFRCADLLHTQSGCLLYKCSVSSLRNVGHVGTAPDRIFGRRCVCEYVSMSVCLCLWPCLGHVSVRTFMLVCMTWEGKRTCVCVWGGWFINVKESGNGIWGCKLKFKEYHPFHFLFTSSDFFAKQIRIIYLFNFILLRMSFSVTVFALLPSIYPPSWYNSRNIQEWLQNMTLISAKNKIYVVYFYQ